MRLVGYRLTAEHEGPARTFNPAREGSQELATLLAQGFRSRPDCRDEYVELRPGQLLSVSGGYGASLQQEWYTRGVKIQRRPWTTGIFMGAINIFALTFALIYGLTLPSVFFAVASALTNLILIPAWIMIPPKPASRNTVGNAS